MRLIILITLFIAFQNLFAQKGSKFDEAPTYSDGGLDGFLEFVFDNLEYPPEDLELCIQGRHYVGFTVLKDGSVDNVRVMNSLSPTLEKESIRLVNLTSRNWIPGRYRGEPVNVDMMLPLTFALSGPCATSLEEALRKGNGLYNDGHFHTASEYYFIAMNFDPLNSAAQIQLAKCQFELDKTAEGCNVLSSSNDGKLKKVRAKLLSKYCGE